jgi:hypothetical protein
MADSSMDLMLRIRGDSTGAEQATKAVAKSIDDFKITTEKTSSAMRGFANDLRNVRDASDLASVATRALSQIIGASLAGTAIVVAGKTLLDAFNSVQKKVSETKDSVQSSLDLIQGSADSLTFQGAAKQAEILYQEADKVNKAMKEIESNPLKNFIAGLIGAKDEMSNLANETRRLALERQKAGLEKGASEISLEAGLTEPQGAARSAAEKFKPQIDASRKYLNQVESTFEQDIKNAKTKEEKQKIIDRKQDAKNKLEQSIISQQEAAQGAIEKLRKEAFDKFDREQAQKELRLIEAEISGRQKASEISGKIDEESAKRIEKLKEDADKKRAQIEEENKKKQEELEKNKLDLMTKSIDLGSKKTEAEMRLVKEQGEMARLTSGAVGTMRGQGQRATSFEIGAQRRTYEAFRKEQQKMSREEFQRIKSEKNLKSNYDVQREISNQMKEAAKQDARAPQRELERAKKDIGATEKTLEQTKKMLEDVLNQLKAYAHAT